MTGRPKDTSKRSAALDSAVRKVDQKLARKGKPAESKDPKSVGGKIHRGRRENA